MRICNYFPIEIQVLILCDVYSRVAELEQENQRLQALAEGRTPPPDIASSYPNKKGLDELRAQLEAARQREQELNEQLEKLQTITQHVKTESQEPALSASSSDDGSSSGASTPLLTPTSSFPLSLRTNPKSGASLGLMVRLTLFNATCDKFADFVRRCLRCLFDGVTGSPLCLALASLLLEQWWKQPP